MASETVRALQDLGFTEYEARVYLALLDESPLSGYGVARASGVPRSKVYEVLEGLAARGAVLVSHGESAHYAPLPPKELIARRRRESEAAIRTAETELERRTVAGTGRGPIWDIVGREAILERARDVIGRAGQRVLLQLWAEDATELRSELAAAARRGVEIVVVAYGDPEFPFATVYRHEPGPEEITRAYGGRWVIVSIDDREVVAGIVSLGVESRAAWTSHPGLVMPITQQITHDLYLAELLLAHREVLENSFGPGLARLREQFGPRSAIREDRSDSA